MWYACDQKNQSLSVSMERSMWYLTFLAGGACEAGTKEDLNRRRCKLNSYNFWRPSECFIISESFFIHLSHVSCMRVTCKSHAICVWVVCELTFWTKFSSKRHPLLSSCDIWLKRVCSWKFCIGKWISNIVSKLLHPRNPPGRTSPKERVVFCTWWIGIWRPQGCDTCHCEGHHRAVWLHILHDVPYPPGSTLPVNGGLTLLKMEPDGFHANYI